MLLWPLTCSFSRTLFFSPKKRAALLSAAAFHLTGWFCLVSLWLSFLSADPWLITAEVELLHFSSNWKRENIYRESYSSLSRENEIWKGEKDASAWLFWIRTTTNSPFWPLSCFLVHLRVVYWTSLAAFIQNIICIFSLQSLMWRQYGLTDAPAVCWSDLFVCTYALSVCPHHRRLWSRVD